MNIIKIGGWYFVYFYLRIFGFVIYKIILNINKNGGFIREEESEGWLSGRVFNSVSYAKNGNDVVFRNFGKFLIRIEFGFSMVE